MTAPESVAEAREVDVLATLEGDKIATLGNFNNGIRCAKIRLEVLGYTPGTPVPTAAHYAALKDQAIEAETYRQMHEIATQELGYPSILEALEACPRAALEQPK